MEEQQMPTGLLMTLAKDPAARATFSRLSPAHQAKIIAKAQTATRREMQTILCRLGREDNENEMI